MLKASLYAATYPAYGTFVQALKNPRQAQALVAQRLVAQIRQSAYGRALGVRCLADFYERVPIVTYDSLRPWLTRMSAGEPQVLCQAPTLFFEDTSGSGSAAKRIPYTQGLRRSFSRMFAVWAHNLLRYGPSLCSGRTYISVSPRLASPESASPRTDLDYVQQPLRALLAPFWVGARLPPAADLDAYSSQLCQTLLGEPRLEIMSVWSPTFLLSHLRRIHTNREFYLRALHKQLHPTRRAALQRSVIDWRGVWPQLKVISAWCHGDAAAPAESLRCLFDHVLLQAKGLLATEAPVTVPWIDAPAPLPCLTEVLLELRRSDGSLQPLHSAQDGATYEVIVSQMGGLYRYALGDRVEVVGRVAKTPCLQFLGRSAHRDLAGEKLSELAARQALLALSLRGVFVGIAGAVPHYVLLTDDAQSCPLALDALLQRHHHYHLARQLGQLGPVQVRWCEDPADALLQFHLRRGLRWGDIKPQTLLTVAPDSTLAALCAPDRLPQGATSPITLQR